MQYDYIFRTIILGDSGVGKTSFCQSHRDMKAASDNIEATIGIDFVTTKCKMNDGKIIKMHIWDTAGQEQFHAIVQSYYRSVAGIIIVFDLTQHKSFRNAATWLSEIRHANLCNHEHPILLIGNKSDLEDKRAVSYEEASIYAESEGTIYVECSCKKYINIANIMKIFYSKLYDNFISNKTCCGVRKYGDKSVKHIAYNDSSSSSYCC